MDDHAMTAPDDLEYLGIRMYRPDLSRIPEYLLPPGFRTRYFEPGDRKTWLSIWQRTERYQRVTETTFRESFGDDVSAMCRRCLFLVSPDGSDIGTATAWFHRDRQGQRWGQLHWVAVVPEFQGRRLSKPLVAATLNLMESLRHRRAFLNTQTPRLTACLIRRIILRAGEIRGRAEKTSPAEKRCSPSSIG